MNQTWNADDYQNNAGYVPEMGRGVLEWLDPQPGERILDLGCGDGSLTETLVASGARVIAMDGDASMVAAARVRGLNVLQGDGCRFAFSQPFDAVFSNAALHWMKPPEAVVASVAAVLKPGGRFVAECGGAGNIATVLEALLAECERLGLDGQAINPWYFPPVDEYTSLLQTHGFTITRIQHYERPIPGGETIRPWLQTFAHSFLQHLTPEQRDPFIDRVAASAEAHLPRDREGFLLDYVRLRFETSLR